MSSHVDVWVLLKSGQKWSEELHDIYWLESDAIADLHKEAATHQRVYGGELLSSGLHDVGVFSNGRRLMALWVESRRIKGAPLSALAGQAE